MGSFKYALLHDREEQLPYLYALASLTDLGIRKYMRLQSFFASPRETVEAGREKWEASGVLTAKQMERLEAVKSEGIMRKYEDLMEKKIRLIPAEDDEYPERLKNIGSPPAFIFVTGRMPDAAMPAVAVVGARECTEYGSRVASRISELLACNGMAVISGMARGIDSVAQTAAYMAGGQTLAILGSGVDICYPKESGELYERLKTGGGIMSEYPPGTEPRPQFFAARNRLIAGMADALCVVEAREKSGTMITVDAALEQGREVFAVPGRITDTTSRGCNMLITQGAGAINDVEGFVEEMAKNYLSKAIAVRKTAKETDRTAETLKISETGKRILSNVSDESFTYEETALKIHMPPTSVLTECLGLCMAKMLVNCGAGRFRISDAGSSLRNFLTASNGTELT